MHVGEQGVFALDGQAALGLVNTIDKTQGEGLPTFWCSTCSLKNFNGTPERYKSGHGSG